MFNHVKGYNENYCKSVGKSAGVYASRCGALIRCHTFVSGIWCHRWTGALWMPRCIMMQLRAMWCVVGVIDFFGDVMGRYGASRTLNAQ